MIFLVVLMTLRALQLVRETTGVAGCPVCLAATAFQQDCLILGLLLGCVALSFAFRSWWAQLPWLLLGCVVLLLYAIDLGVLHTLAQRLYLFDILKFGKELKAIVEFSGVFVGTGAGKIALLVIIPGLVLLGCMLAARPHRPQLAAGTLLLAILIGLFGRWQPATMSYIHYELLQDFLTANLDLGIDKGYSAAFAEQVQKQYVPPAPTCSPGQALNPNVIYVAVESLSMNHSALFSGARDLTPNLDALAREYSYFPDFYANGFTTDGGLIALLTGKIPIPAIGRYNTADVFGGFGNAAGALPETLREAGYDSHFFTTGDLGFLDKTDWLKSLRFDSYEGAEQPFYNGWKRRHFNAAEDKALYLRFMQWLDQRDSAAASADTAGAAKPWFSMLLTVSTHPPFVNPENEAADEAGAFSYADKQIGVFYAALKQRGFFHNGILLISGDHRAMVPLLPQEQVRFGDSALARTPLVMITDLPLAHGAVAGAFQQADLLPSLADLTHEQACRTPSQGVFLRPQPIPGSYIEQVRGDRRDRVAVFFDGKKGDIVLDGDNSRWLGPKPANWEQILLAANADRIQRGRAMDNYLDLIIRVRNPAPAPPAAPPASSAPAPATSPASK